VDQDKLPVTVAPEIAIEIVSASDSAEKLERKIEVYLQGGVKEVWAIYANTRHIWVCSSSRTSRLSETDTLTTSVLPGWSLAVGDLFTSALRK
jgi:Uma2 family endonuclease